MSRAPLCKAWRERLECVCQCCVSTRARLKLVLDIMPDAPSARAAIPLRRAVSSSLSVKFEEPEDVVAKREAQSRPMSGMSTPGGAPGSSPPLSRAATPPAKGLAQVRVLRTHPAAHLRVHGADAHNCFFGTFLKQEATAPR